MDAETKKLLVLIHRYGNCLKDEKMPENLKIRIWNKIKQKIDIPKLLMPMPMKSK